MGREIKEEFKTKNGKEYIKYSALENGEVIGTVILRVRKFGWTILDLNVHPLYRRKGVARELIGRILDKNQEKDIFIRPRPYRDKPVNVEQLKSFYEQLGFIQFNLDGTMVLLR